MHLDVLRERAWIGQNVLWKIHVFDSARTIHATPNPGAEIQYQERDRQAGIEPWPTCHSCYSRLWKPAPVYVRERTDNPEPTRHPPVSAIDTETNGLLVRKRLGDDMYAEWINSSNGLPREGQQIEFLLDSRNVAMEGSYTRQAFHSHWAKYEIDRVSSWRNLRQERELTIPTPYQTARVLIVAPSDDSSHHLWPAGGLAHAA